MKPQLLVPFILALGAFVASAQEIRPIWVQHHNGLVNVDPANKIPILVKQGATGTEAYASQDTGMIKIEGFVNFLRYDNDHYLVGIRENGIDETTETDPAKLAAAAQYPDRSVIWIDAHTGKSLGVAAHFPYKPVTNVAQGGGADFFWKWAIDEGVHGERVIYTTFRYKIIRWAPAGLVDDPAFPNKRPTWSTTPTEAWVEPIPDEPNPTVPPWDKWVTAIHSSPAPTGPEDTAHLATYIGSSGGDGSASWRLKAFRVTGSGTNTHLWAGGATWRASMLEQEFVSADGGLTFYPVARLNDRGDNYGAKNSYGLGGQPSNIRTEPDGRRWCIQGHFPGTGWEARPGRYTLNPNGANDDGLEGTAPNQLSANDAGANHKDRPHFYDPDNRATNSLPAFTWESAGTAGICGPTHRIDGVEHYDGNWVMTSDTVDGVDYIVSYAIPSWNQQFGGVGTNWPTSVDPNSIFKPGWVGVHTLDGKIAVGQSNAWKLPCYETDEPILDPSGNGGTGFDYGYDGDVHVYRDTNAPAGSQRSVVLVAFGEYGFGAFEVQNVAADGTMVSPSGSSTRENQPLLLQGAFTGTGTPLLYEWQKDDGTGAFVTLPGGKGNLAKFGSAVTTFQFSKTRTQLADAGRYRFIVGNSLRWYTSQVATVSVAVDTLAPVGLRAGSADGTIVDIQFDEPLDPEANESIDPLNYQVTDDSPVGVVSVTLRDDARAAALVLGRPLNGPFTVSFSNLPDLKGNSSPTLQPLNGTVGNFLSANIGSDLGVTHSTVSNVFQIEAAGTDFWGAADSGHFLYQPITGDFDARVQITANTPPSNRNGIMVRESLDPASAMVNMTWNPNSRYGSHVRATTGANVDWFSAERNWVCDMQDPPNVWLRLQRRGSQFKAYRSADGLNWIDAGTTTVALPDSVLLGLAANSGSAVAAGSTTFSNFGTLAALSLAPDVAGVMVLSWTGEGILEASPAITGPWSSEGVSQTNPQDVVIGAQNRFFRLRLP